MMRAPAKCAKCGGGLSAGFIVDQGDYSLAGVSKWQDGAPHQTWYGGVKQDGEQLEVSTYRCDRCGYLESYALNA